MPSRNEMYDMMMSGGRGQPQQPQQQQGMGDTLAGLVNTPDASSVTVPGGGTWDPSTRMVTNPQYGSYFWAGPRDPHPEPRDRGIEWGPGTQQPLIGGNFFNDPGLTGVPTFTPDPTPVVPPLTPEEVTRQQPNRQQPNQPQPTKQPDEFVPLPPPRPPRGDVDIGPLKVDGEGTRTTGYDYPDYLVRNPPGDVTPPNLGPFFDPGAGRGGRILPPNQFTQPDTGLPALGTVPPMTNFRDIYNPRGNYIPGVDPLPPSQFPPGPLQYTPGGRGGNRIS